MRVDNLRELIETGASREEILDSLKHFEYFSFAKLWTLDDIIGIYQQKELECDIKKAREIADIIERKNDEIWGINWDFIRDTIDIYESSLRCGNFDNVDEEDE